MSTTINQPSTGWIEFDYNSALVVKDYSLKYGDTNVNYLSLTNDKYVSSFDGVLRSRPIRMTEGILDGNVRYYTGQSGATKDNSDNIVYFDPTSNVGKCSESDYNTANSTQGYNGMSPTWGKTTCLRWYVYSIDNNGTPDDDSDDLVNMILDHNTTSGKSWSGSNNYTGPSSTFLTQLQTDTSGWTSSKLQNPKSYSVSWSNGGSNRSYSIDYLNDYGIKARLIEANEVARIAGKTWWTISSNYFSGLPSYLYANLSQTSRNTNEGYWTSSPDAGNSYYDFAWLVRYDSYMSRGNTSSSLYGIRPVITVLKSDIFS